MTEETDDRGGMSGPRNLGRHYVTVRRVRGDVVRAMRIVIEAGGRDEEPRAIHAQKSKS